MPATWILGRGGLLGSAVESRLCSTADVWVPTRPIRWVDHSDFRESIDEAIADFADVIRKNGGSWIVFWCAGIGTFGASDQVLDDEFAQVGYFLKCLTSRLADLLVHGTLFYASSAGALYGGSLEEPVTEDSAIATNSPYGEMKLRVENLLEEWSNTSGCRVAIGRISNLYGPHQDVSKRQGLITTASFDLLRQRPLNIFVPLDTTRNYIYVDDAAHVVVGFAMKVSRLPASTIERKIVCSPHNLSVAAILQEIRRVFGRRQPFGLGRRSISALYVNNLSMISRRHRDVEPAQFLLPLIGIAKVRRQLLVDLMTPTASQRGND